MILSGLILAWTMSWAEPNRVSRICALFVAGLLLAQLLSGEKYKISSMAGHVLYVHKRMSHATLANLFVTVCNS